MKSVCLVLFILIHLPFCTHLCTVTMHNYFCPNCSSVKLFTVMVIWFPHQILLLSLLPVCYMLVFTSTQHVAIKQIVNWG